MADRKGLSASLVANGNGPLSRPFALLSFSSWRAHCSNPPELGESYTWLLGAMTTAAMDRPCLPSIRSIPVLAQYLPRSSGHLPLPSVQAPSTSAGSSKVEVIDLTGSEDSEDAAVATTVPSNGTVESPGRGGKKLSLKACGSW